MKMLVGVEAKIERVKKSLNAMEQGKFSEFTIDQCCDYIAWLAKFKKAPREVWLPLCEQAIEILSWMR